jgi:hypothetical protein
MLLHVSAVQGHHQVTYKRGFLFHCTLFLIFSPWPIIIFLYFFPAARQFLPYIWCALVYIVCCVSCLTVLFSIKQTIYKVRATCLGDRNGLYSSYDICFYIRLLIGTWPYIIMKSQKAEKAHGVHHMLPCIRTCTKVDVPRMRAAPWKA